MQYLNWISDNTGTSFLAALFLYAFFDRALCAISRRSSKTPKPEKTA